MIVCNGLEVYTQATLFTNAKATLDKCHVK